MMERFVVLPTQTVHHVLNVFLVLAQHIPQTVVILNVIHVLTITEVIILSQVALIVYQLKYDI